MNIRIEAPPADADYGSRYKALIHAAQVAGGAWVAVNRNEMKDSPAQLRQRIIQAAGRAGVEVEIKVAARTAHVRTIFAAAQPASPSDTEPTERDDDEMVISSRNWDGFWAVVTGMDDSVMKYKTVAELAEFHTLMREAMAAGPDAAWTPERRALSKRQLALVERAFRRMQHDPIDDPHPGEMTQILDALDALETWLWGHPIVWSSADRYRVARKLGCEWEPEAVYNAIQKLADTPCEPNAAHDAAAKALRDAISTPGGLTTALERILKQQGE